MAASSANEEPLHIKETCSTSKITKVYAGRIQFFLSFWSHITKNTIDLSWIEHGLKISLCTQVTQSSIPLSNFTYDEARDMQIAIKKLLELGAISRCMPCHDQYTSKIFLAPKAGGTKRFILNLKSFNKFVKSTHFKMEDHITAAKLIPQGGFLATSDLKEVFYRFLYPNLTENT